MTLEEEVEALRRHLDRLAHRADDDLIERYELKRPPMPPGLYWRLRWLAGRILHWLKAIWIWRSDSWPVALRQANANVKARPLLIWAVGADRETLREVCDGFSRLQDSLPGFAPVLVTDVADFAFFSRLGWLVEYVPRLSGDGIAYEERKLKFLARLYRGAPALPVNADHAPDRQADDFRRWLSAQ